MDNNEYDKYMCDKYPVIFKSRGESIQNSCMAWGFEMGEGWQELLDKLCEKIQLIMDTTGIEVYAAQVKQKFGGLRFYVDMAYTSGDSTSTQPNIDDGRVFLWHDIVYDLIDNTEKMSLRTCEKCGKYGELRKGGWLTTLCNECADGKDVINQMEG